MLVEFCTQKRVSAGTNPLPCCFKVWTKLGWIIYPL